MLTTEQKKHSKSIINMVKKTSIDYVSVYSEQRKYGMRVKFYHAWYVTKELVNLLKNIKFIDYVEYRETKHDLIIKIFNK